MHRIIPDNPMDPEVISFKTMRMIIGILAIALPVALLVGSFSFCGCKSILGSISSYYHTRMRDVFVGILCAVSLFLFSYKGYGLEDFLICKFASAYALGIAFCPTLLKDESLECIVFPLHTNGIVSAIHYFFAAGFFVIIACISICIFTQTHPKDRNIPVTRRKTDRNRIYIGCGIVIMACIALIPVYDVFLSERLSLPFSPIFWLETLALASFGISWLVKGGAVAALNDRD